MSSSDGTFRARMMNAINIGTISKKRRLQFVAVGQGVAAVTALIVLGLTAATGMRSLAQQSEKMIMNPVVPMSVAQGETLWSLAKRYGNPAASQLERVDTLAQANGLSASAMLHPGQRLVVPVENPREAAALVQSNTLAKR